MSIKTWSEVKDEVFGPIGDEQRDGVEREVAIFKERLLKRKAKEENSIE